MKVNPLYFAKRLGFFLFHKTSISPQYQATIHKIEGGGHNISHSSPDGSQPMSMTMHHVDYFVRKKKSIMLAFRSRGKEEIGQPMFNSYILF